MRVVAVTATTLGLVRRPASTTTTIGAGGYRVGRRGGGRLVHNTVRARLGLEGCVRLLLDWIRVFGDAE